VDSFKLSDSSHQAEVLYFHDNGFLKDSVPPLAIAISGDALILAWRGFGVAWLDYAPAGGLGFRCLVRPSLIIALE
jgi:hypothetical protein